VITYVRPTYSDLKVRIAADLAAVPLALRDPLSVMWARACNGQYGFLEWIWRQCSPLTCDLERLYDWAALYGVERLAATAAVGNVLATGTVGTQILKDTLLRGTNGLDYIVLIAVTLTGSDTPVPVRCTTAGSAGNLLPGQTLTLIDPIPGCANTLTVDFNGLTGGAEEENLEDWRTRVVDEWRAITTFGARGGRDDDYRFWARAAHPSVTGALVQRHVLGIGTVLVRPICNGLPDRLPTQGVLDAVAAYFMNIAPATADWRVAAPIPLLVGVSIHLFPQFDTQINRDTIDAAVQAVFMAESTETSVLAVAEIDAAIATVTTQYDLLEPTANTAVSAGEVLVKLPTVWV
jgi:uncharacterized phage protein gp47/JayE